MCAKGSASVFKMAHKCYIHQRGRERESERDREKREREERELFFRG